jgi:hypothetical protein
MRALIILSLLFSVSAISGTWQRVPALSGKLYIPDGHDDNDLVEIIITGKLPDLCHRSPTFDVEREGNQFNIYMYAYYVPQEPCRPIEVPYMEKITLGMLGQGQYKIRLFGEHRPLDKGELLVKEAVSSLQDEFNYGNVTGIKQVPRERKIQLLGTNPVNCLRFEKLESEVQEGVIVLRPHFREEGECLYEPTPFEINYTLPELPDDTQDILIHVRVMDGRSFNVIHRVQ